MRWLAMVLFATVLLGTACARSLPPVQHAPCRRARGQVAARAVGMTMGFWIAMLYIYQGSSANEKREMRAQRRHERGHRQVACRGETN